MTLRSRLLATSLCVAIPLGMAWSLSDAYSRQRNRLEQLRLAVDLDMAEGLLERCEADPPREGRPGRGGGAAAGADPARADRPRERRPRRRQPPPNLYEYFAYDHEGRPSAADAPPLPADEADGQSPWRLIAEGPAIVVPGAMTGPCATILARIPIRPGERRSQAETLLLVLVSVAVAVGLSAAPLIRRLRRLEAAVRASAASRYSFTVPVEGRDEIAAVARAFNEARGAIAQQMAEARSSADDLRRHIANTTHDVGTPLTSLHGTLADLERTFAAHPAAIERVHEAMRDAHYMASLLRNLSTVVALDTRPEAAVSMPVDLSAVVERVVARHAAMARAHGVALHHATPGHSVVVTGDPILAEQLLSNLVDNAIRYNHHGGHVAVLLDVDRGGALDLSVTDDGPGVPDAELSKLTTRWYRGTDARTRRPEGSGIGLAVAAEAAARLSLSLQFSRPSTGGLQVRVRPLPPRGTHGSESDRAGRPSASRLDGGHTA